MLAVSKADRTRGDRKPRPRKAPVSSGDDLSEVTGGKTANGTRGTPRQSRQLDVALGEDSGAATSEGELKQNAQRRRKKGSKAAGAIMNASPAIVPETSDPSRSAAQAIPVGKPRSGHHLPGGGDGLASMMEMTRSLPSDGLFAGRGLQKGKGAARSKGGKGANAGDAQDASSVWDAPLEVGPGATHELTVSYERMSCGAEY